MEYRYYYQNEPVLTPAEQEENARREREYFNTVTDRKAAYTKARKRVNRAQKKARRANRK